MRTVACRKSVTPVIVLGLPVILHSIAVVCEELEFRAYGGMVGGSGQYGVLFHALIVSRRKSGAVLRF